MKRYVLSGLLSLAFIPSADAQVCNTTFQYDLQGNIVGRSTVCSDPAKEAQERQKLNQQDYDRNNAANRAAGALTPLAGPETFSAPGLTRPGSAKLALVREVISPNEIRVNLDYQDERIRLIGLNAFSVDHPLYNATLNELLGLAPAQSNIFIETDGSRDKTGAILAYVWQGNNLMNLAMIERGMGTLNTEATGRYQRILENGRTFYYARTAPAESATKAP